MEDRKITSKTQHPFDGLEPWTVEASRYPLRDEWITVRADSCRTQEGVKVDPYYVIESSDWVHMAVFNQDHEVLINQLYRHGNGEMSYEIPAGTMDEEDTDPEAAARRELQEETGFTAEHFTPLSSLTPNSARYNNCIHNFIVTGTMTAGEPRQDDSERILFEFLPVTEVLAMIRDGRFRQSTQIATIFMALQELGWMQYTGSVGTPRPTLTQGEESDG